MSGGGVANANAEKSRDKQLRLKSVGSAERRDKVIRESGGRHALHSAESYDCGVRNFEFERGQYGVLSGIVDRRRTSFLRRHGVGGVAACYLKYGQGRLNRAKVLSWAVK